MTRETIITLCIIICGVAWLAHTDPVARVAMTVHQAEDY